MNKQQPSLDDLFRQSRVRPRLVNEDDVRTVLAQSDASQQSRTHGDSRFAMQWKRGVTMAAVALVTGIGVQQMLTRSQPRMIVPIRAVDTSHYRVEVIRDPVSGDSSIIMLPPQDQKAIEDNDLMPTGKPSIAGVHLFELTPAELARLGVRIDPNGAMFYNYNDDGKLSGEITVGYRGTIYRLLSPGDAVHGLDARHFFPAIITDDIGAYRMISYEGKAIDSALTARMKSLPRNSPEYFRMSMELSRKGEQAVLQRFNTLVPIVIRTGRQYTQADSIAKHWRPDVILWYEPTPAFLAALPERLRRELAPELEVVQKSEVIVRSSAPHQPRRAAIDRESNVAATPIASDKSDQSNPSKPDSVINSPTISSSDGAVTGGPYLDASRTSDGAIIMTSLYPNPAREETTLLLRLDAPRIVTVSLYDIFGRKLKDFTQVDASFPGERGVGLDLRGVREGIYLVVATTEKQEMAVQRLVVTR